MASYPKLMPHACGPQRTRTFHNHFNSERHLVDRQTYKIRRSAALAEWQNIAA